jgi:hypothetical protein
MPERAGIRDRAMLRQKMDTAVAGTLIPAVQKPPYGAENVAFGYAQAPGRFNGPIPDRSRIVTHHLEHVARVFGMSGVSQNAEGLRTDPVIIIRQHLPGLLKPLMPTKVPQAPDRRRADPVVCVDKQRLKAFLQSWRVSLGFFRINSAAMQPGKDSDGLSANDAVA